MNSWFEPKKKPASVARLLVPCLLATLIVWAGLTSAATVSTTGVAAQPAGGFVLTVNVTDDANDGSCDYIHCSLREAIEAANNHPNFGAPDLIVFAIPGSGVHTIMPSGGLPSITDPVIIDGLTQPGASCATWPPTLLIELDGSDTNDGESGLILWGGSTVTGLVINRFDQNGVYLDFSGGSTLHCNFIGTDASGMEALGNHGSGVWVWSDNNVIGGETPASRNLISGNLADGITLFDSPKEGNVPAGGAPHAPTTWSNLVQGNFIGTNVWGTAPLGNQANGVEIIGAYDNTLGGTTPGTQNVISGNAQHGILLSSWSSGNRVQGNNIGSGVDDRTRLGNGGSGIYVENADGNTVGGLDPGAGNQIAFNGGDGITVVNLGTDGGATWGDGAHGRDGITAVSSYDNAFFGNQIEANDGLGIDLNGDGPTLNDIGDSDGGANDGQNYPLIFSAVPDGVSTLISGRLDTNIKQTLTLEFFENSACDASTYGEGEYPLGSMVVDSNLTGRVVFSTTVPFNVPLNHFITATATNGSGNTSEFGPCQAVGPNNVTWPLAYRLPLAMPTPPDASTWQGEIDQYLSRPGQSRWYKVSVTPQSKLTVKLTNLPANYDLTLFKDIAQVYQSLNPPQSLTDLAQLGAEFAPDAFSPDVYSPDVYSPDVYSPDMYSPDVYSPDVYSPDVYSPDVYSPDVYSPDVYSPDVYSPDVYSPDVYSPDVYSPDVYSPDVYSPDANAYASAQLRSVLAVAGFEGTASEGITINTWDNSGDFYIRVRGRNGAFSPAQAFHLEVTLQSDVCDGVTSDLPAPSLAAAAGNFHTLILTDRTRLAVTDPLTPTLGSKLLTLAGRPEVNAEIIDVSSDARVAAANAQADSYPACPTAKNLVADAIKTVVDRYRLVNPLEYIVLVGSDDVIPFFRHLDQALLASERNYVPPVRDSSASQASLRLGYVLSQDDYGAAIELDQKVTTFPVPDLAVGRLVETPA